MNLTKKQKKHSKANYRLMPFKPKGKNPSSFIVSPVRFYGDNKMYFRAIRIHDMSQWLFETPQKAYIFAKANKPENTIVSVNYGMLNYWRKTQIARKGWILS